MKRGGEYLTSPEKLRLDRTLLVLTAPLVKATELVVMRYLEDVGLPLEPVTQEPRVGKNGTSFLMHKFVTIDPETGESICPTADRLRRLGLDELAQVRNIREGTMSFSGWRSLLPLDFEEFREQLPPKLGASHDIVTTYSLPGLVSSYGNYAHFKDPAEPDGPEVRAEMNIQDFVDASTVNHLGLMKNLATHAVSSRLS